MDWVDKIMALQRMMTPVTIDDNFWKRKFEEREAILTDGVVKRPNSRWDFYEYDNIVEMICHNCGRSTLARPLSFCDHCGADMRKFLKKIMSNEEVEGEE